MTPPISSPSSAGKTYQLIGFVHLCQRRCRQGAVLTGSTITEIVFSTRPFRAQTTQDHVLVNTNGWNIDAAAFFTDIGAYAG